MDVYTRLRPYTDDEPCDCASIGTILLVHILTDNPIRCFQCKGYVDPARLSLNEKQVEAVATWDGVFGSLYRLWLDSAEYEDWAKAKLLCRDGRVNHLGLLARSALANSADTYYWWFHDTSDAAQERCACCNEPLSDAVRHGTKQCDACRIVY